jgi:hypothetical protein
MLRAPLDTKQIQAMAAEIYSVRSDELDFCEHYPIRLHHIPRR